MSVVPIFIPVSAESKPLWEFQGDWTADEKAILEGVVQRHSHKHKRPYQKRWVLVCRRLRGEVDYHATFGTEVALYGESAERLGQSIDRYYVTGKTPISMFEFASPPSPTQSSGNSDEWLNQVKKLREEDKVRLHDEQKQDQEKQTRQEVAMRLLHQSKAHELLLQIQKALLDDKGVIKVLDQSKAYDRAIVLMWQGSISTARTPDKADEPYSYILVGVKENKVWVNGTSVVKPTPEAMKATLLEACKNPQVYLRG